MSHHSKLKWELALAVKNWAGGDPEEQEDLIAMRDNFYRLVLEHQFQSMD